ncbi:MAG: tRNA (guanosine(37)-N1)-methyltransferase TrmD [Eubacterium sp.]|nr:tRNA (guanosine(37)-N1)-methyltransferase TrmD [Eubacterium sp.]
MKFHVVTLFPDMIRDIVHTSITGRAVDKGILTVDTVNIRDYSIHGTKRVDDYPYGGGAGMVMEPEPVFQAICEAKEKAVPGTRVVYLTPQAKVLTQIQAEELAREEELILLCGHYEGIDERVLEECVTDYVSIGDYVLTGGELAAAVLIDAVSRFVPGVLHNEESSRFESLQESLLEYPHYTRPEVWHDKAVPEVLRSGDHEKTECWRREQALQRTMERRPDLLDGNFRLITIWFGPENGEKRARDLSSELSHFSEVMKRSGFYQFC